MARVVESGVDSSTLSNGGCNRTVVFCRAVVKPTSQNIGILFSGVVLVVLVLCVTLQTVSGPATIVGV